MKKKKNVIANKKENFGITDQKVRQAAIWSANIAVQRTWWWATIGQGASVLIPPIGANWQIPNTLIIMIAVVKISVIHRLFPPLKFDIDSFESIARFVPLASRLTARGICAKL